MTKFKPLGNRILVRRSKAPQTKSGIFLPDSAQEKPKQGVVIAVGPGSKDENDLFTPVSIPVGSSVFFGSYAGTEVPSQDKNEELLILSEDEVLAVVEQ